jgi:hypothetical protein
MDRYLEHGDTPLDGHSFETKKTLSPEKQAKGDRDVKYILQMFMDQNLVDSKPTLGTGIRRQDAGKLNMSAKASSAAKVAKQSSLWIHEKHSDIDGRISISALLKKAILYYNPVTSSKLAGKKEVTHKDVREIVEGISALSYEITMLTMEDQTHVIKAQIDELTAQLEQLNAMLAEQKKVMATEPQLNYREIAGGILNRMSGNKYSERGGYNHYAAYIHDKVNRALNPLAYVEVPTADGRAAQASNGSSSLTWREARTGTSASTSTSGVYVPIHLRGKVKPAVDKDGFQTVTYRNTHAGMSVADMMRDRASTGFKTEAERPKHVAKDVQEKKSLTGDDKGTYVTPHRRQAGCATTTVRTDSMSQFPSLASAPVPQPKVAAGAWGMPISANVLAEPMVPETPARVLPKQAPPTTRDDSKFCDVESESDDECVSDDEYDDIHDYASATRFPARPVLGIVSAPPPSADGWTSLRSCSVETSKTVTSRFVPEETPDDWETAIM